MLSTLRKKTGSILIKGLLILLIIAFGAGLISFLSPCVLPLIPGYISYISGESLGDIAEKQKKVLLKTILFPLGFSLVFINLDFFLLTIAP